MNFRRGRYHEQPFTMPVSGKEGLPIESSHKTQTTPINGRSASNKHNIQNNTTYIVAGMILEIIICSGQKYSHGSSALRAYVLAGEDGQIPGQISKSEKGH